MAYGALHKGDTDKRQKRRAHTTSRLVGLLDRPDNEFQSRYKRRR